MSEKSWKKKPRERKGKKTKLRGFRLRALTFLFLFRYEQARLFQTQFQNWQTTRRTMIICKALYTKVHKMNFEVRTKKCYHHCIIQIGQSVFLMIKVYSHFFLNHAYNASRQFSLHFFSFLLLPSLSFPPFPAYLSFCLSFISFSSKFRACLLFTLLISLQPALFPRKR